MLFRSLKLALDEMLFFIPVTYSTLLGLAFIVIADFLVFAGNPVPDTFQPLG